MIMIVVFLMIIFSAPSKATVYLRYDAESGTVGSEVPTSGTETFNHGGEGTRGTVRDSPLTAPQGLKYFGYTIVTNQHDAGVDVYNQETMPFDISLGTTYYLAYFFNFAETGDGEVYRTNIATQEWICNLILGLYGQEIHRII
jgi:hypothetical protein